jgi:hypothetical protein
MRRLCVFAGSRQGGPLYVSAARAVAVAIVRSGYGIVYGGGRQGLMGVVADAALAAGGDVRGVIPRDLMDRELAHPGLSSLSVVSSMHERKATMYDLSSGFVAIPGGLGTLDETFETLAWRQLGIHRKNLGLLDVAGYWEPLVRWIERALRDGFIDPCAPSLLVDSDPDRLIGRVLPQEEQEE